ncbi:MAG: hypothetical protein PHF37_00480 [Phycisphaerae bacterium]|nr:hypothetical protein [Phycisphaerae bacterium]
MTESAIVEEIDSQDEQIVEDDPQPEPADNDYDIEEPDDDEEVKVPVIDNLDEGDDKVPPSKDKNEPKPTAKAEKEIPGKPEVKATEQVVPDELVAKAKKLGVSDEDLALFTKPEQLERLCSLIEPSAAAPKQEKETAEKPNASYEEGEFKLELDSDLYDPDICNAMKSTAEQINGLKNMLNNVVSVIQRQSEESFEKTFEGFISGLGDQFGDTLGKGTLDEIGKDSEFFKNRCKLIEEMNAIATGYNQTGKPIPKPKELFKRAVNSVFGDSIKKNAKKEIAGQLAKRSNQIISRPTGRNGKDTQTPEQRATTAVREKLREFGANEEIEIEEEF